MKKEREKDLIVVEWEWDWKGTWFGFGDNSEGSCIKRDTMWREVPNDVVSSASFILLFLMFYL